MANYFLTEELYGEIRKMIAWFRQRVGRGNADPMQLDHEEHPTPDVYIARTGAQGIPASVLNFTATGTSTGSDLQEGPLGHGECVIYRADTYAAIPKLLSMSFTKTVYNPTEVAVPAWAFIEVRRDKYGTWWSGPPVPEPASKSLFRFSTFTTTERICTAIGRYRIIVYLWKFEEDSDGRWGISEPEEIDNYLSDECCECPGDPTTGTGTISPPACGDGGESLINFPCCDAQVSASDSLCWTRTAGTCGSTFSGLLGSVTLSPVATVGEEIARWVGCRNFDAPITLGWPYFKTIRSEQVTVRKFLRYTLDGCPYCVWDQRVIEYSGRDCTGDAVYFDPAGSNVDVSSCSPFSATSTGQKVIISPTLSCEYDATITKGICAGDFTGTGTGGGTCPCSWQYSGGFWTQISGSGSCIAPGLIPTPTEGEIRTTNNDGTTCSGGGGGLSPTCASIADTDGSYSTQNNTGIFGTGVLTGAMTANGGKTWTGATATGKSFHLACIDNVWWMTYDGLTYAVEATLFYGALSFGFDFDDEQGACRVIVVMNPA